MNSMDVTTMHIGEIYLHIELLKKAKQDVPYPKVLPVMPTDEQSRNADEQFREARITSQMLDEKIALLLNEIFRRAKAIH